ncbi:MAG TPA: SUKH-3 domain-containing protein [Mobilitalea sp.]|nr:SUKH-3 domain-containing protein [Mobilitalea sp.]
MSGNLKVYEILKEAGWYEGRRIDTSFIEKHYNKYGFELFPAVLHFLEEFGMLNITIDKHSENEERHHTNPLEVVGSYFRYGKFKVEEGYAGERLVPVGKCCNEYSLLFVSESGKIYYHTGKIGDSPWEAWETLINKTGFKTWGTLYKERCNNK